MTSPTRSAGLDALNRFLPHAGWAYASGRNYDLSEDHPTAVSQLSPYLRHRLISEPEVISAVTAAHDLKACEKFVQEVFWRTYWKGWLEMRPSVWAAYLQDLQAAENRLQTEAGLRAEFEAACGGQTEIACFNFWAHTIVKNGYIHNHARMWFASIWIFTLRLPWALGADFFMRHLLDGDAASNTLSWRWVGGIQTRGKTYLATPDNIEKFTRGRFCPPRDQLAEIAPPLDAPEPPRPQPISEPMAPLEGVRTGWLFHDDDLSLGPDEYMPVCGLSAVCDRSPRVMSDRVVAFSDDAIKNVITSYDNDAPLFHDVDAVLRWAVENKLDQIVTAYAPVGPAASALSKLNRLLKPAGISLARQLRPYDQICWPKATKGFFKFKEQIPDLLRKI